MKVRNILAGIILVMGFIFLLPLVGLSSQNEGNDLPPLANILTLQSFLKTSWNLSFALSAQKYPPKTKDIILADLEIYLKFMPGSEESRERHAQYKSISNYQNDLKSLIDRFVFSCDSALFFIPLKDTVPINFFSFKEKLGVLISSVAIPTVFNTLNSSSDSRAKKVITSCCVPLLKYFYDSFRQAPIEYYVKVFL